MTKIEKNEQMEICYQDVRKLIIEARDRDFKRVDTGASKENYSTVRLRYDMYLSYLDEAFKALNSED